MKTKFQIRFFFEDEYKVKSSIILKEIFHDYPANARIGTEIKKFRAFCEVKGYTFNYAKVEKIYY